MNACQGQHDAREVRTKTHHPREEEETVDEDEKEVKLAETAAARSRLYPKRQPSRGITLPPKDRRRQGTNTHASAWGRYARQ